MGTVELTGLEITRTNALGAVVAIPVARPFTMPALICNPYETWFGGEESSGAHLEEIVTD